MGDNALILGQQLCRAVRQGPGARGGHGAGQRRARPDRPGAPVASATPPRSRGRRAATRTSSPSCATRTSSATSCWSSSPTATIADTLMRQFLFDTWHYFWLQALSQSSDPRIAEIAAKSVKEVTYHLRRSGDLVVRLGDGTERKPRRCRPRSTSCGCTPARCSRPTRSNWRCRRRHRADVPRCASRGCDHVARSSRKPRSPCLRRRGCKQWRAGRQAGPSPASLGYILAEMQFLQRAYPGAHW